VGIGTVEDKLIERLKGVLRVGQGSALVRDVQSLPGDWDKDMLKYLALAVPGIFVVFAGGPVKASGGATPLIEAQWKVFAVTGHASGQVARRRGDKMQVGAYDLLQKVIAGVHGHTIPDEGTLMCTDIANLHNGQIEGKGLALYAATFAMTMGFPMEGEPDELAAFETFHVLWDTPVHETAAEHKKWLQGDESASKPDAKDDVQLEQG
jgi:phage gp37-like protein